MNKNFNNGKYDVLLNDEAEFIHTHDEKKSRILTPDGQMFASYGEASMASQTVVQECEEMRKIKEQSGVSRRNILKGAGIGAMMMATPMNRYAFSEVNAANNGGNIIIVIFLRGGMDGLSAVIPMNDPNYQKLRPNLGLNDSTVLPIDGSQFGLHPALVNIQRLIKSKQGAIVHSTGHTNKSRSHFDKQYYHESGAASTTMKSGWLGRYLASTGGAATFRALTISSGAAFMMANPNPTLAISNLGDFTMRQGSQAASNQVLQYVRAMWGGISGSMESSMKKVIDGSMATQEILRKPATMAYINTSLGQRLSQASRVIKANVGLEVCCVDNDGWDMHGNMGNATDAGYGVLKAKLQEFDTAIGAFWDDLGPEWQSRVTILTMSEFGRTSYTNGGNGTDHGYGNVMFAIGKGMSGGVQGDWSGLADSQMDQTGSGSYGLGITNDYRDVIAEVLTKRMGVTAPQLGQILPDYSPGSLGLIL